MICQGIVPAHEIERLQEVKRGRETVTERVTETVAAAPCTQTATMLARSKSQQTCNLGSVHWVDVGDKAFCSTCYVPGVLTYLDGTTAEHAPMDPAEYRG